MHAQDTIVALSSGALPSGIAVIRVSGSKCQTIIDSVTDRKLIPRTATLLNITIPGDTVPVDRGIALWFPKPNSFTGEDCLELQVHGGRAVVQHLIDGLAQFEGVRVADAGEFSRRAFENGRLDLTALEGLSDLIASDTEAQRKQAFLQSQGELRDIYDGWRDRLVHVRAMIEAELDFADEDDVPDDAAANASNKVSDIAEEIRLHLDDHQAGEIIRDGFQVALLGKPNAGKSSLLNALAKRDVAIVTEEAGTTRDVLDVHMDIDGYAVTISDTAGIRDSETLAETEGVKRAEAAGKSSNLVIWLQDIADGNEIEERDFGHVMHLVSKDDGASLDSGLSISAKTGHGVQKLLSDIGSIIEGRIDGKESAVVTRARHRGALERCLVDMDRLLDGVDVNREVQAELLRAAGDSLGKITGRIDVEDLLDAIFSEFCIGK